MTFKERLGKEYPERAADRYMGGCCGCPGTYGYDDNGIEKCHRSSEEECTACWNREIPDADAYDADEEVELGIDSLRSLWYE